MNNTQNEKIN